MQFDNHNKKLIIVTDEWSKPYANYLLALISSIDDEGEKIVGTKDNSVQAVVWSEKHFKDNEPTLSSNSRILFVGDSTLSKEQREGCEQKFDKYGMHYGWLGKRAVMYVDRTISDVNEYNEFFDFASNNQANITKLINDTNCETMNAEKVMDVVQKTANDIGIPDNPIKTGLVAFAGFVSPVVPVAFAAISVTESLSQGAALLIENNEVLKQQYSCLTMVMYLKGLNEFLEG